MVAGAGVTGCRQINAVCDAPRDERAVMMASCAMRYRFDCSRLGAQQLVDRINRRGGYANPPPLGTSNKSPALA